MNRRIIKNFSFMRHAFYLVVLCFSMFLGVDSCFALTSTIIDNYNFGTFTQTNQQASFVLSYDGSVSSVSNLSISGNPVVGQITITSNQNGDGVTFSSTTSEVSLSGCSLTFSNITPSLNGFTLNPGQGKSRDVSFGLSVSISGFCDEGTYNISGVAVDASGSKTGNLTTMIPFTVTFTEHVDIQETTQMNFGRFFTTNSTGSIAISPQGGFEANGVNMYDGNSISPGRFVLGELLNREVQLTFSDAILSNGANTMKVSNLYADVGNNFTVSSTDMPFSVGGTLSVSPNQPSGIYTGTYSITITY